MRKIRKETLCRVRGKIVDLHLPGGKGIRVDTAVYTGYTIPHTYDSMIAKLIVHDKCKETAVNKMKSALSEFVIDGIETNIEYLIEILNSEMYMSGEYDTSFVEKFRGENA